MRNGSSAKRECGCCAPRAQSSSTMEPVQSAGRRLPARSHDQREDAGPQSMLREIEPLVPRHGNICSRTIQTRSVRRRTRHRTQSCRPHSRRQVKVEIVDHTSSGSLDDPFVATLSLPMNGHGGTATGAAAYRGRPLCEPGLGTIAFPVKLGVPPEIRC